MTFLRNVVRSSAFCAVLAALALAHPHDAAACGGCFHPENDPAGSVVTDHRMVFEITSKETILWDQVRYAGNPAEFAWVLPVRAGARIELSRGEWIAALDAATQTTVNGPRPVCPPTGTTSHRPTTSSSSGSSSGSSSSSGGGGCGGSYTPSSETAPGVGGSNTTDDGSSSSGTNPTFTGDENVDVVAQSSIGPYQAVTIRASGTTGITAWLKTNGFAVPASIAPVIDAYIAEKLDFIALRLAPNQGVQAMRPVRVVTPGADTTLPLRMVAAGVGATVGLTLWVIGEGRYEAQNFPNAPVDWSSLAWNVQQMRSNRTLLEDAALASNGGRSWITEAAVRTTLTDPGSGIGLPNVHDAYLSQCQYRAARVVRCNESALPPPDGQPGDVTTTDPDAGAAGDAGGADGGDIADAGSADGGDMADAGSADGGSDGGGSDGGVACTKTVSGCDGFDDLDVGADGLHSGDVWVTRLRANLPVSALSTDLELGASAQQVVLSPVHSTSRFTDPTFDPCAQTRGRTSASASASAGGGNVSPRDGADGCTCRTASSKEGLGTWLLIGLTMVALPLLTRRRRPR
jgi:MYXO-CTERM domain-containing protein